MVLYLLAPFSGLSSPHMASSYQIGQHSVSVPGAGGEAVAAKQEGFHLSNQESELYPEDCGSQQRILG